MSEELRYITLRKKELPDAVKSIREEVIELSRFIYTHPELGSEEYQAYEAFVSRLKRNKLEVTEKFLGMDTAFLAKVGKGEPRIAVFAEYDALPIGHACGHNLLGAWAYGVTLAFAKTPPKSGTLYLVGSPAEEGRGKYASSKVIMAPKLKDMGIEAVFAVHPQGEWGVGGGLLATQRHQFVFHGKDAHAASSAYQALNALDAAVQFYVQARMLRNQVRRDKDVIISAIIKDGGTAPNIIPGRAEVWLDIRSNDSDYLPELAKRIEQIAEGAAKMTGCTVEYKLLAPPTASWKRSKDLEEFYVRHAKEYLPKFVTPDEAWSRPPVASADTATVSQYIPTAHLSMKIGREGMPGHSEEWKQAAGTKEAEEALMTAIAIGYETVIDYCNSRRK